MCTGVFAYICVHMCYSIIIIMHNIMCNMFVVCMHNIYVIISEHYVRTNFYYIIVYTMYDSLLES